MIVTSIYQEFDLIVQDNRQLALVNKYAILLILYQWFLDVHALIVLLQIITDEEMYII